MSKTSSKTSPQSGGSSKPKISNSFKAILGLTIFFVPVFTFLTVYLQPEQVTYNYHNENFSDMIVRIKYQNPLLIPIKYWLPPRYLSTFFVDLDSENDTKIKTVQLVSPSKAVLSFDGNFKHNGTHFEAQIDAAHTGLLINQTDPYVLNVFYQNASGYYKEHSVPFQWTIMASDLTMFGYFWVVLAGVIASRFITFVLEKKDETEPSISLADSAWIAFTFVIAVIGFASFKEQLSNLTSVVIFNISLAFGFGFASQKILEVARLYPDKKNTDTGPTKTGPTKTGPTKTGSTEAGSLQYYLRRITPANPAHAGGMDGKKQGSAF